MLTIKEINLQSEPIPETPYMLSSCAERGQVQLSYAFGTHRTFVLLTVDEAKQHVQNILDTIATIASNTSV